MSQYIKSFYSVAAVAVILIFASPVMAQTVNNLNVVQPPALAQPEPEPEIQQAPPPVPEASQPAAPEKQKTQHVTSHKKHHKKKSTHKTTAKAHKKATKKKTAHKKHKAKKKTAAPAPAPHARDTHQAPVVPKVAAKTTKPPSDASMAAVVPVTKSPPEPLTHTANTGTPEKSVAYNFCLGYDNCVPHRYESSGKTARVLQQDKNGNWAEAKLDPTIMADLNKMAQAEPGSRVERDLTPQEKSVIAGHQGKMHAMLVSFVEAGAAKKEELKTLMRELRIKTMDDLNAYDPRLCKRDVAVQAVNEISVGR